MSKFSKATAAVEQFSQGHPVITEMGKMFGTCFLMSLALFGGLRIATIGLRNDHSQYNMGVADGLEMGQAAAAGHAARQ